MALALLCGCWSSHILTLADAPPGAVGYGLDRHVQVIFLVTAVALKKFTGTARAAYSPELGPDALWRVHGRGGYRLEYCAGDGLAECTDVAFTEEPGRLLTLVEPANLGSIFAQTTVQGGARTTARGQGPFAGVTTYHATPHQGVWVHAHTTGRLYYCHVATGTPVCEALDQYGAPLGVMMLSGEDPTDVLWVAHSGGFSRCSATASRPTPVCEQATMQ